MVVMISIMFALQIFPALDTPWIAFLVALNLVFLACWLTEIALGRTSRPCRPVVGEKFL